jgi:hypothetical protein
MGAEKYKRSSGSVGVNEAGNVAATLTVVGAAFVAAEAKGTGNSALAVAATKSPRVRVKRRFTYLAYRGKRPR